MYIVYQRNSKLPFIIMIIVSIYMSQNMLFLYLNFRWQYGQLEVDKSDHYWMKSHVSTAVETKKQLEK